MNSPNFPFNYPNHLHKRKTIEVAKGNIINIYFTDFELEKPDEVDYVEITDGDGTLLGHFGAQHYSDNFELNLVKGERRGKRKGIKISNITSVTETVHVLFHTDESVTRRGWHLEWSKCRQCESIWSSILFLRFFSVPEKRAANTWCLDLPQLPDNPTIQLSSQPRLSPENPGS